MPRRNLLAFTVAQAWPWLIGLSGLVPGIAPIPHGRDYYAHFVICLVLVAAVVLPISWYTASFLHEGQPRKLFYATDGYSFTSIVLGVITGALTATVFLVLQDKLQTRAEVAVVLTAYASPLVVLALLLMCRRIRPGHCPGCDYDLRASMRFGRCPECGMIVPTELRSAAPK